MELDSYLQIFPDPDIGPRNSSRVPSTSILIFVKELIDEYDHAVYLAGCATFSAL